MHQIHLIEWVSYNCFPIKQKSGIFHDLTNATAVDHDISVVGYGVDKDTNTKYWLIRNSWGTYWVY